MISGNSEVGSIVLTESEDDKEVEPEVHYAQVKISCTIKESQELPERK